MFRVPFFNYKNEGKKENEQENLDEMWKRQY